MYKTISFSTACTVLNIAAAVPEVSHLPEAYQKVNTDFHKANVIADAINFEKGSVIDYEDGKWKHSPRFYWKPGVGFSCDGYDDWDTGTHFGSRLCFLNEEDMIQFCKIIKEEGLLI